MKARNKGSVLLVALFVAGIGTYLVTSYIQSALLELEISDRNFFSDSAVNLAEAGAESAVLALNQNDWSNWTITGDNAFRQLPSFDIGNDKTGIVRVEVQDISSQKPTIFSDAQVALDSGRILRKEIEVGLRPRSRFANAFTARYYVYFYRGRSRGNTIRVDSYDSEKGPYDSFLNRSDGGSVAGKSIYTYYRSKAEVYGYLGAGHNRPSSVGRGGRVYGSETPPYVLIDDERVAHDFKGSFPDIPPPAGGKRYVLPDKKTVKLGNKASTESYHVEGDLTIKSGNTLRIRGKVIMRVDDDFQIYGKLVIESDGELEVYIADDLRMNTSAEIDNKSPTSKNPDAAKLRLYSTATRNWRAQFWIMGEDPVHATIYAPRAYVDLYGDGTRGTLYGSVVGDRIIVRGNYNVHFDEQLKNFADDAPTFTIDTWKNYDPDEIVDLPQS